MSDDEQVVESPEALADLPFGTVVVSKGLAWQRVPKRERMSAGGWVCADLIYPGIYNDPTVQRGAMLPAIVVWRPVRAARPRKGQQ